MNFIVVTPVYNAEKYIERCIKSLQSQTVTSWRQILIDDNSTDGTIKAIQDSEVLADLRISCYKGTTRMGAPYTHHWAIQLIKESHRLALNDSIVVHLDGDDFLMHSQVLEMIAAAYEDRPGTLATYGNYISTDGSPSVCRPVTNGFIRDQIKIGWPFSHLRTFRASLLNRYDEAWMKDSKGEWLTSCGDAALFTPILEMCGLDRILFNREPLVIYNRSNPLNEDKANRADTYRCAQEIWHKPSLKILSSC